MANTKEHRHGPLATGDAAMSRAVRARQSYTPVFRFVVIFATALMLCAVLLSLGPVRDVLINPHLTTVASICGRIINAFGSPVTVTGTTIWSDRLSIEVVEGCDSIYPTALLWSAMLALPVSMARRLVGFAAGAAILFLLNIIRVVSMYVVGIVSPTLFAGMHLFVWQGLFILLTISFFLFWAQYALAARDPA